MFAFQKTPDGNGESYSSEVFFMRSKNFLTLRDNDDIALKENNTWNKKQLEFECQTTWETLPLGEYGLQTNRGLRLGEEPHLLQISGSRLLCFWRTDLGFLDSSYSDDYGRSWTSTLNPNPLCFNKVDIECSLNEKGRYIVPEVYTDAGACSEGGSGSTRKVINDILVNNRSKYLLSSAYSKDVICNHDILRNPRGAITPIRLSDNYFALLYYNNGHTDKVGYVGRLVYWLTLGNLNKSKNCICWSQPELVLWWDGILLDNRENWNEDWAIVDGAGYADFQELQNGNLAFVESNKLTVRYHEIPASVLSAMKNQFIEKQGLSVTASVLEHNKDTVYVYNKRDNIAPSTRAPVLPDLRSGGGFTLTFWMNFGKPHLGSDAKIEDTHTLIKSLSKVSGALDEENAPDITKGYEIIFTKEETLRLFITDGFKTTFSFEVDFLSKATDDYYEIRSDKVSMVSFIVDGGPKVASCVINNRIYNAAPCGWKFFPREFGEIGGANVIVNQDLVDAYIIFDRALLTCECINLAKSVP